MKTLQFPQQTNFYRGKVRDVYTIHDEWLVMIASDRISAFDVILPRPIPYKGQVLNQIAAYMLKATRDICPNWLVDVPAPNVSIGKKCVPFRVEMVVRGNLTVMHGEHMQRENENCAVLPLPEGSERKMIIFHLPSLHHQPKRKWDMMKIFQRKISSPKKSLVKRIMKYWKNIHWHLFERGKEIAAKRGLILVDTKYEFGKIGDTIYLMDEIHTPDSSRYFYADGFEERQAKGEKQKQLSKEFVREWLIANNFMGKEGQTVPEMNDEWVETISQSIY